MSIQEIISKRAIEEVLHFTTHRGLTGVLHQKAVAARAFLKENQTLEFILKLNTEKIFDAAWKKYVNLSISRINKRLFGYSENWHPNEDWRILAFDPVILCENGVQFVTTNNAYWQHLKRGTDPESFEALFAQEVLGIYGRPIQRIKGMPDSWTTDVQAEVLYPNSVPTKFLKSVYVRTQQEAEEVAGLFAALQHPEVPIKLAPEKFQ